MPYAILGISAFFHDSAAVLIIDGEIIAAAQEERFTRIKNDASFPIQAITYVLKEGCIDKGQLDAVAFYEKPLLKFERLLETYHAFAPVGLSSFLKSMPIWLKDKLFLKRNVKRQMNDLGYPQIPVFFPEHHLSHAASAFYPSPFEKATILTIDGVGEWATMTIGIGEQETIRILKEQHFPHSIGLLYSAFTYYLGFEVNKGEYKLMGLAAYGRFEDDQTKGFIDKIQTEIIDSRPDGSIVMNMSYFKFATHLQMTNDSAWAQLFGLEKRDMNEALSQAHANLAFAIQHVTESIVFKLVDHAVQLTGEDHVVMAGGVALNSVLNGKLIDLPCVKNLWIQPAAGDSGGALGAALAVWHIHKGSKRQPNPSDSMKGALLGPEYSEKQIHFAALKHNTLHKYRCDSEQELIEKTVDALIEGKVIGWFQGRMEFGPRALGNRSIIADPRHPDMQRKINSKIKFRESFRPFAPCVLEEDVQDYFDLNGISPYMLLVKPIKKSRLKSISDQNTDDFMTRLSQDRSDISSVTHVDGSARIQTVHHETNPLLYKLLQSFKIRTGYAVLINTSFNVKDEPIVCSPEDALRCFSTTEMDLLVMNSTIMTKV